MHIIVSCEADSPFLNADIYQEVKRKENRVYNQQSCTKITYAKQIGIISQIVSGFIAIIALLSVVTIIRNRKFVRKHLRQAATGLEKNVLIVVHKEFIEKCPSAEKPKKVDFGAARARNFSTEDLIGSPRRSFLWEDFNNPDEYTDQKKATGGKSESAG